MAGVSPGLICHTSFTPDSDLPGLLGVLLKLNTWPVGSAYRPQ